jgi:hypothetical protein
MSAEVQLACGRSDMSALRTRGRKEKLAVAAAQQGSVLTARHCAAES